MSPLSPIQLKSCPFSHNLESTASIHQKKLRELQPLKVWVVNGVREVVTGVVGSSRTSFSSAHWMQSVWFSEHVLGSLLVRVKSSDVCLVEQAAELNLDVQSLVVNLQDKGGGFLCSDWSTELALRVLLCSLLRVSALAARSTSVMDWFWSRDSAWAVSSGDLGVTLLPAHFSVCFQIMFYL